VVIQARDFKQGDHFVLAMQRAFLAADRTLVVLSPEFMALPVTAPTGLLTKPLWRITAEVCSSACSGCWQPWPTRKWQLASRPPDAWESTPLSCR
jgi:hypothetical protein